MTRHTLTRHAAFSAAALLTLSNAVAAESPFTLARQSAENAAKTYIENPKAPAAQTVHEYPIKPARGTSYMCPHRLFVVGGSNNLHAIFRYESNGHFSYSAFTLRMQNILYKEIVAMVAACTNNAFTMNAPAF